MSNNTAATNRLYQLRYWMLRYVKMAIA